MSEGFLTTVFVVMLIWGILEIILFFKILGMTNDIAALKKRLFREDLLNEDKEHLATKLRHKVILGDIEDAKKLLLEDFVNTIEHQFGELSPGYYNSEKQEYVSYEKTNMLRSIRPNVEKLTRQFEKMGEKLPEHISRMNTYKDYFALFTKEDFA